MFNVTPYFRSTQILICPSLTPTRLDGNLLFADAFHKRAHTPPALLGLGLEITKELWEVIITVISSQKRRPPTGKRRRPALGKSFLRRERPTLPRAAARPAPSADLFFCPWIIQRSRRRPAKEGCAVQVFPMASLCLQVEGQRKKGDGKKIQNK